MSVKATSTDLKQEELTTFTMLVYLTAILVHSDAYYKKQIWILFNPVTVIPKAV